jgi:hypothetical protein
MSQVLDPIQAKTQWDVLEVRGLRLFDDHLRHLHPPDVGECLPVVKALVFEKRAPALVCGAEVWGEADWQAIRRLKDRLRIFHSPIDFHPDSTGGRFLPNLIIDLVLIGDKRRVEDVLRTRRREREVLRRRLMYRMDRLRRYFEDKGYSDGYCFAYRGELSLPGRYPNGDIDLLLSCPAEDDYAQLKEDVINIAAKLGFMQLDWIEMHPSENRQKRATLPIRPEGEFRLDCYASVAAIELQRIRAESVAEALWTLGVLQHSMPLLNAGFFAGYVRDFESEVGELIETSG